MLEEYATVVQLIERLHRHFLDVLRTELRRVGNEDINAVQALLLFNIGEDDVVIRDLRDRGYYHGSNVSYNIKKLTEMGYLTQERSPHDRRATRLQLTDRGFEVRRVVKELQGVLVDRMGRNGVTPDVLRGGAKALEQIERTWTDYVRYGPD
ncbi:helix-turn-helix domain-containing protein [Rhodospira trueperi]|uniref:DNA-binding transcriptional regulator, MarR family n=1 Tax=Rhodospira trueperi TaxID=69960 RepID=A0A1G7BPQ7_9PROT|nr:MarR family transcriptional regulator [Rhodospira trueperi]SDE29118.1 DNA-binding transcriptional regulator, MarR family [Rhodospira trueperi]